MNKNVHMAIAGLAALTGGGGGVEQLRLPSQPAQFNRGLPSITNFDGRLFHVLDERARRRRRQRQTKRGKRWRGACA